MVSVVAPTYRRRAGLAQFVEPLLSQPALTELVMAVDAGPAPGSPDGHGRLILGRQRHVPRGRESPPGPSPHA